MVERLIPYVKKGLWLLLALGLAVAAGWLAWRAILLLLPLLLGMAFAVLIDPIVRFLVEKLRFRRPLASVLVLLAAFVVLGGVIALLSYGIVAEVRRFSSDLPKIYASVTEAADALSVKIRAWYGWLPPEVTANLDSTLSNLSQVIIDLLKGLISAILSTAVSIPQALIFATVFFLSTYFVSSDKDRIFGFVKRFFKPETVLKLSAVKTRLLSTLFGYIRAQLIIMAIIFSEVAIGFSILGIGQPLLFALIIAVLDQIPYIGVMTFLLPMAAYQFTVGNARLGVGILVLYAIIWTVRQLTDPKIVGRQIGVHPLLTLAGIYVGFQVFGVFGLILGPLLIVTVESVLYAWNADKWSDLGPPPRKPFRLFKPRKGATPPAS